MIGRILFVLALASLVSISQAGAASFADVQDGRWFAKFVDYLAQHQIISGYPDGTFRPEKTVTRAEFAAMLDQVQDTPVSQTGAMFADVPRSHWAYAAISTAAHNGWIAGYPDGTFKPSQTISTAEMYAILAKITPGGLVSNGESRRILRGFSDAAAVPRWAERAVATALKNGTFVSEVTPYFLEPLSGSARAEVATVLAKLHNPPFRTPVDTLPPVAMTPPFVGDNDESPLVSGPPVLGQPPMYQDGDSRISIVGTLHPTVEAGGWIVRARDGREYLLVDIGAGGRARLREGAEVQVRGRLRPDMATIYMQGTPLEVDRIRTTAGLDFPL